MGATLEKTRATSRDFFRLGEGTLAQLINGEIIISPAPKILHQDIGGRIYAQILTLTEKDNSGKVFISPIDVRFSDNEVYQPDIVFISNSQSTIIKDWGIDGAPNLIIEVLSVSTAYYDLTHKKRVYEDFGVKEYLVVDPMELTLEQFYYKDREGFISNGLFRNEGEIPSKTLPGLLLNLKEIFRKR